MRKRLSTQCDGDSCTFICCWSKTIYFWLMGFSTYSLSLLRICPLLHGCTSPRVQWSALHASWTRWLAVLSSGAFTPGKCAATGACSVLGGSPPASEAAAPLPAEWAPVEGAGARGLADSGPASLRRMRSGLLCLRAQPCFCTNPTLPAPAARRGTSYSRRAPRIKLLDASSRAR